MRLNTEEATRADLATGRSIKPPEAVEWSHSALSTVALTASLQQLRAFPRMSDAGNALATEADLALQVRTSSHLVSPQAASGRLVPPCATSHHSHPLHPAGPAAAGAHGAARV